MKVGVSVTTTDVTWRTLQMQYKGYTMDNGMINHDQIWEREFDNNNRAKNSNRDTCEQYHVTMVT